MKSEPKPITPANVPAAPAIIKSTGNKQAAKRTKHAEVSGKLGKVVGLLKRPKGATVAELMKATGWQAHSVRGAISGAIKRKLKLAVLSEKRGDVRSYRIKA
jgi:hypothetical protein